MGQVVEDTAPGEDWLLYVGVDPGCKKKVETLRSGGQRVAAYWIGSDSRCALTQKDYRREIPEFDVHLCVHERIAEELKRWGVEATVVYPCARNPSDGLGKPQGRLVGVYMPEPTLYMFDECLQVARENPDLRFVFYGAPEYVGLPANVTGAGRMTPEDTGALIDSFSVVLRLCQHDGFPVGGIECKQRNRHIIENYPYPGFLFAETLEEVNAFLQDPAVHEGDFGPWPSWYREKCSPAAFQKNVLAAFSKIP